MAIYALGDVEPDIHPDAYVHPDAVVIGNVRLGAEASVWPTAVLRGDDGYIEVGARTSVQDGTIVHCTATQATIIGADCTVGHNVHIEGATIADRCLISSGSVVLNGATIEYGSVVAAGAVVSPKAHIPARSMALGVPARVREGYEVPEGAFDYAVQSYIQRGRRFRAELRLLER
ncbi:gamma carbonic anhydrase family protein [Pseudonocardia bannensis]|uniref:Gamma carbonic anhydrase family protein n=1 Tax=Pseudonocardia bannensis TaxID=630973 RepID=A0A848DT15_9PSEU|nr:gamma carbonic anhydrase family protein [Pseudonocardia bannensis]NMH95511.1 gamma carbonic anhydrase family protein [Pseudonocardia bannensis]